MILSFTAEKIWRMLPESGYRPEPISHLVFSDSEPTWRGGGLQLGGINGLPIGPVYEVNRDLNLWLRLDWAKAFISCS